MWIKINVRPNSKEIIFLPKSFAQKLRHDVRVSFGEKSVLCRIEPAADIEVNEENSFDKPVELYFSSRLISILRLPEKLTYQMKIENGNIIIGPVIGLLLGERNHVYNPRHMEKYSDRFGIYKQVGGLIYAFSPRAIDWNNMLVYGLYYDYEESKWKYGNFPLPSVIYRRDFHSDPKIIEKLIKITHGRMFNSWRFSKFYLYLYMKRDKELSQFLPPTTLSRNYEQVKRFIDKYKRVILKPISLSRGRGICIIDKYDNSYKISDYRLKNSEELEFASDEALKEYFEKNRCYFKKYLIQKRLALAKINKSPFDIRVVMQKEKPLEWKCTGIECRVAAPESMLTNISRGGYALTLDEALKRAFPDADAEYETIKNKIYDLCHKICERFDKTSNHFAEFGMDIAIDEDKNLWIIEVNVFPSFKGFKKMDYNTYLNIRHTPILYAANLAGF